MRPILIHVYRRGGDAGGTDEFGDRIEIGDSRRDFVWTQLTLTFGTLATCHPSGQYVLTKWMTLGRFHHPSGQRPGAARTLVVSLSEASVWLPRMRHPSLSVPSPTAWS